MVWRQERSAGGCAGDDDVAVSGGVEIRRGADGNAELDVHTLCKGDGGLIVDIENQRPFDGAGMLDGGELDAALHTGATDERVPGIGAGEILRGDRGCGAGARDGDAD